MTKVAQKTEAGLVVIVRDMTMQKALDIINLNPDKVIVLSQAWKSDADKMNCLKAFEDSKVVVKDESLERYLSVPDDLPPPPSIA